MIWDQVRMYLLTHPEQTAREIGETLKLRVISVRHVLGVAYTRGLVSRSATTPYTWWLGGKKPSRKAMPRYAFGKVQAAVIGALKSASVPLSSAQIGGPLGLKRATRDRALQRLEERGLVQRVQERPGAAPRWRWAA